MQKQLKERKLMKGFCDLDEDIPPENAGETFKKMLIKEVAKNEH